MHIHFWQLYWGSVVIFHFKSVLLGYTLLLVATFSMPLRKKVVIGILTGVDENHRSETSTDQTSMHSNGVESSGKTAYRESREMMAAIEDLQRS